MKIRDDYTCPLEIAHDIVDKEILSAQEIEMIKGGN